MPATQQDLRARKFTRRQFLVFRTIMDTEVPVWEAMEAVASVAIEHPEWDMDEEMTWAQWQAQEQASAR